MRDEAEFDRVLASGEVLFAIEIPRNFERAVRRGETPAHSGRGRRDRSGGVRLGARARCRGWCRPRSRTTAACRTASAPLFEVRTHARYNPAAATALNIVPGLVGTILTMTMLIFTALSVTREIERGTMESLLSMPITPFEIMIGKIVPYIIVGFVQASLIIGIGIGLFGVPVLGSLTLLAVLSTLFIAANLAIGYTFSTIAQNQLQAMQMSMMFFLPNILLSGFMFPFAGMPVWAQWIGEAPAAHALPAHRARDHAEGLDAGRPALRCAGAHRADGRRHADRGDAVPPHPRLSEARRSYPAASDAGASARRISSRSGLPRLRRTIAENALGLA